MIERHFSVPGRWIRLIGVGSFCAALMALAGCGQKGALRLAEPPKAGAAASAPTAPMAPTTSPQAASAVR